MLNTPESDELEQNYGAQQFAADVARQNTLNVIGALIEDRRRLREEVRELKAKLEASAEDV